MIQVLDTILLIYFAYSAVSIFTTALYFTIKVIREERELSRDLEKIEKTINPPKYE